MTLLALIRKRDTGSIATAIPAIPAIPDNQSTGNEHRIARIAKVAVANPKEAKTTAADFDQEWFAEKAAIYEYDGGLLRAEAERRAYLEVMNHG